LRRLTEKGVSYVSSEAHAASSIARESEKGDNPKMKKTIDAFDGSVLNVLPYVPADDKLLRRELIGRLQGEDSKRIAEVFFDPSSPEKDKSVLAAVEVLRRRVRTARTR